MSERDPKQEDTHKRRKKVLASYDDIRQAVDRLDTARTGTFSVVELNGALDRLGIKVRKSDLRRLAKTVEVDEPDRLPQMTKGGASRHRGDGAGEGDGHHRSRGHGRSVMPSSRPPKHQPSLSAFLKSKIAPHWRVFQKDMMRMDPDRIGLITIQDFLTVLEQRKVRLSAEQVDALYLQYGVGSEKASIRYPDLLRSCVSAGMTEAVKEGGGGLPGVKGASRREQGLPQIGRAEETFMRLAAAQWKPLRQACRSLDIDGTKALESRVMRGVLLRQGLPVTDSVMHLLCRNYPGPGTEDTVAYNDFIGDICRRFLATSGSRSVPV